MGCISSGVALLGLTALYIGVLCMPAKLLFGVPAPVILSDFREIGAHRREILGYMGCDRADYSNNPSATRC